MTIEKTIFIEGSPCPVTVSDDDAALLTASEAGRAVIGILRGEGRGPGFGRCLYLTDDFESVTGEMLELAARRRLGVPWTIAETERLVIREFADGDPLEEPSPYDCGVFSSREARAAYIRGQYRFAETGLWALVRKADGIIVGKAGITDGELGYHIYPAFRGLGYAAEAAAAILAREAERGAETVTLRAGAGNLPSVRLAEKLGFRKECEKDDCILFRITL